MTARGRLSRRDFLKLSGLGLFSLFGPDLSPFLTLPRGQQGRVIYDRISLHKEPSFSSEKLSSYTQDEVLPISKVVLGSQQPAYNRIWYRIGSEGYGHSGGIQPVKTLLNPVVYDLPQGGVLAEVTVPFTDAIFSPDEKYHVAYRFYYETTHWVSGVVESADGTLYYHIIEDKWDLSYYVPAKDLRIIPAQELSMISPEIPNIGKKIIVRTDIQTVIAYEYQQPVFMVKGATGAKNNAGRFRTPTGIFQTNYKRPSRHMATGNLAYSGYDLPGVPWIIYLTDDGIAFHGTYWHNDFGKARSHGCINLPSSASKWLYRWTLPFVPPEMEWVYQPTATLVEIRA